jgi:hypothetical protein
MSLMQVKVKAPEEKKVVYTFPTLRLGHLDWSPYHCADAL